MERLKKLAATVAAYKEKIGLIAIGQTFNAIFDQIFDYWLYIPIIALWGPYKGGAALTIADIIISLLFIKFYDWAKKDWLGLEAVKEIKEFGPAWIKRLSFKSRIGRIVYWPFSKISLLVLWVIRMGDVPAFFAISMTRDPFITTVYLRKKSYGGMGKRDWRIFFASAIIGNAWWILVTSGFISIVKSSVLHLL